MPISLEEAKRLRAGQTLYHVTARNADGTAQRWRVNGKVTVWKRSPGRVRVPVKHGLYSYDAITECELHLVCLSDPTEQHA